MHALAFSHVDTNGQVPDPQAVLVEHRRHQHVGQQVAAILAQQGPLARFALALLDRLGKHRLSRTDLTAVALAQRPRTRLQLLRRYQIFKGQLADDLSTVIAEHAFGTGVEGTDHPAQTGGNDRHLGGGIQHAAQLAVGITQGLFADAQLGGTLLDQGQGPLALAEQAEQQGTEQQAEQAAEQHHGVDRRGAVGVHERQAGLDIQLIVMIGQA
ncbi:hypothetical protein D9M71_325130 [compost metagenome]